MYLFIYTGPSGGRDAPAPQYGGGGYSNAMGGMPYAPGSSSGGYGAGPDSMQGAPSNDYYNSGSGGHVLSSYHDQQANFHQPHTGRGDSYGGRERRGGYGGGGRGYRGPRR